MKKLMLFFLFWLCVVPVQSQTLHPKAPIWLHAFYVEGGGAAGYYSLNYESTLQLRNKPWSFSVAGGYSYYQNKNLYNDWWHLYPMHLDAAYGKDVKIELGYQFTILADRFENPFHPGYIVSDRHLISMFKLGFRYQKNKNGLYLKADFYPIINGNGLFDRDNYLFLDFMNLQRIMPDERKFLPWYGISIGYSFKAPAERHRKQKDANN